MSEDQEQPAAPVPAAVAADGGDSSKDEIALPQPVLALEQGNLPAALDLPPPDDPAPVHGPRALGCGRCRNSKNGCETCQKPTFTPRGGRGRGGGRASNQAEGTSKGPKGGGRGRGKEGGRGRGARGRGRGKGSQAGQ